MQNRAEFRKFCLCISILPSGDKFTDEVAEVYWDLLKPYSDEQCCAAFKAVLLSAKFCPGPAEIIEKIEKREGISDKQIASMAWDLVRQKLSSLGAYRSPLFEDPRVGQAIESCGGWMNMCQGQESEIKWLKRDFIAAFGISNSGIEPVINQGAFNVDPPVRIACPWLGTPRQAENILPGAGRQDLLALPAGR